MAPATPRSPQSSACGGRQGQQSAQLSPPVPQRLEPGRGQSTGWGEGARAGGCSGVCSTWLMPRTPEAASSPLSIPPLCPSLAMWGVWCGGHPAQLLCSGTRVWGSSCPSSAAQTGLHALPSPVHVSCGARGCRWGRFCCRSDCPSAGCAMLAPEHWAGTRARVVMLGLAKLLHWGQFCQGCGVLEWLGWVDFAAGGTGAAGFGGAMQCWGGWARLGLARVGPALRAQGCSALGLAVSLLG